MTSEEYQKVRQAVAIIDRRDDSQDQRIELLEAKVVNLMSVVDQLQLRLNHWERQARP